MEEISFRPQQVVFKEGDPAENLYLIKQGEVIYLKLIKGRLVPVFVGHGGDILGEPAMMKNEKQIYSCICVKSTVLLKISKKNFEDVFSAAPDWLINLTQNMIDKLEKTSSLIAENKLIHQSVCDPSQFTNEIEIQYKKILSQ